MDHVSLCQLSFLDTTFAEDIAIAQAVGATGLGVAENKLPPDDASDEREQMEAAGIDSTICAPSVLAVLPQPRVPRFQGPADPDERLALMLQSVRRLAPFGPDSVFCVTGPAGERPATEARAIVVEHLRVLGEAAAAAGTRFAVEPMREEAREDWTIVSALRETMDLLDEVGRDDVGMVFDTWHLWDSEGLWQDLPHAIDRVVGVQIADYRSPNRGPRDRVAAGDGIADIPRIVRTLHELGYRGWYDMEVFSDDGRFGYDYPDSLWKLPPEEFARVQVDGFRRCCERASEA